MKQRIFIFLFLIILRTYAVQVPLEEAFPNNENVEAPWFTGPLITSTGMTISKGHIDIEPYLYVIANTGNYNRNWKKESEKTLWNLYSQTSLIFGLSDWLDFEISPTFFYNATNGASSWALGDLPIEIDIQLYKHNDNLTSWGRALKLEIIETVPVGKYKNLKISKEETDLGGKGSWQTQVNLVFGNLFYLGNQRFLTWRIGVGPTFFTPVSVENQNAYGGALGTSGTVHLNMSFDVETAVELSLSRHWALSIDLISQFVGKTKFTGISPVSNESPFGIQLSMAPALEYNFSARAGLIFGAWFSFAGKNAASFTGGVAAFNQYF